ncbi:PREDICTED: non-specific lipid-transfer protein-like protein At2g13820 [Ipomoea nil]|uniref:non-specific lipid-transfer protein-like protein At2g13820 n=1 Tax=Ipomoea nil TaxID=35883 RepID=UPI00090131A4|nr:PREDICTED: non-specific lipid-transfer protein-like protein At2g13820 [Ipomoea nil]
MAIHRLSPCLVIVALLLFLTSPLNGQIVNLPCSPSTLTSFAPCLTFVTSNSTSPSSSCCNILKSVTSNGTSCLCFIASGAPFQVPINRNLTLSLPRACQMPSMAIQCKASGVPGAPSPASSPVAEVPTLSPKPAPGPSRDPTGDAVPKSMSPAATPKSDANPSDQTPPPSTANSGTPAKNSGNPPAPSVASFMSVSPLISLVAFGVVTLKLY